MIPILYEANETAFISNGVCRLRDCLSVVVVEERNSIYELDFEYPVTGANFDEIQCGRIIAVKHDDTDDIQPFDIVSYSKPINGIVSFHAVHISYRLRGCVVEATNVDSLSTALTKLATATPANDFTYEADFSSSGYAGAFNGIPLTVRQLLGGVEGSILDTYGGEYEWDKFRVILHKARGATAEFKIRYGLNMVDYNEDVDYSETYTSAIPFWKGDDGNGGETTVIGSKVDGGFVPYNGVEKCIPLDLSDKFETEPTAAQLESYTLSKMKSQKVNTPQQSIKVDFVRLNDFEEFGAVAPLLQCKLCDSIEVIFPYYNTSGLFKIVRTEYDVLRERFTSMELGALSTTLAEALGVNEQSSSTYSGSGGGGGGGTSNYNDLTNKPSINSVTLSGNKTSSDLSIHDLPSGGSTGQVLVKNSNTNYDVKWSSAGSGTVTDVQVDGTSVVSSGIATIPKAKDTKFGVVKTRPYTSGGSQYVEIIGDGVDVDVPVLDAIMKVSSSYLPTATVSTKGAVIVSPTSDPVNACLDITYGSNYYSTDKTARVPLLRYDSGTQTYDPIRAKYLPDFVGTDGNTAGTKGAVPAPATTDAGKFLKADGTWATVSGGTTYTATSPIDITSDVISHENSGVTAGTYDGGAVKSTGFYVPSITVDAQGHITSASDLGNLIPLVTGSSSSLENGNLVTGYTYRSIVRNPAPYEYGNAYVLSAGQTSASFTLSDTFAGYNDSYYIQILSVEAIDGTTKEAVIVDWSVSEAYATAGNANSITLTVSIAEAYTNPIVIKPLIGYGAANVM